ncbi:MAG: energy transducer TonB [Sphingobacteriales bacterium]
MKLILTAFVLMLGFSVVSAQQPPPKPPKDPDTTDTLKGLRADTLVFMKAEHEPEFPGGMNAFYKFIRKNLNQPKDDSQGKVYLSFVIEKDGSITNIQVLRSLSAEANAEAIRVMMKCPKWNPGIQNGKPVRVKYVLPIEF